MFLDIFLTVFDGLQDLIAWGSILFWMRPSKCAGYRFPGNYPRIISIKYINYRQIENRLIEMEQKFS